MPRFALTPIETALVGQALYREARARGLSDFDALVAAANTTTAEFRALVQNQLTAMKAGNATALAAADAANTARKAALTDENTAIDSALSKF